MKVDGDELSQINTIGLVLCLLGISGHIVHKLNFIRTMTNKLKSDEEYSHGMQVSRATKHDNENGKEPLLLGDEISVSEMSDTSDVDSNLVLYEVTQRRDAM